MKKSFLFIAFTVFALAVCGSESKSKRIPVLVGHESQVQLDGVNELSGICLSKNGDFLFGVDDEGGVYRINIDDNYTFSKEWDKSGEMEGLAINPKNGDLYIGLEDSKKIAYKVSLTDSFYDYEHAEKIKIDGELLNLGNDGLEGITFYKDNLYLGTQTGANLIRYNLKTKQLTKHTSLKNVKGCDIKEIAGLDYDEENDWLWVIDSEKFKIYLFNGKADELLASYYIGDTVKKNPEGLCVDKKRKCIWVCEDILENSLLHKYSFDF